ncbi:response regulator [bacterium]|nr:response regulator [bacterium]
MGKTKGTPVIFMSGTIMDKEFQQEGIELGAVDYITKPVNLESLVNKIKNVLEGNSKKTDSM